MNAGERTARTAPGAPARRGEKLWLIGLVGFVFGTLAAGLDFNHDTAISYAAALRHLDGQGVYRDFGEPHGPVAGWLFTPLLGLAPTGGWALVLAGGLLNAVAAVLVARLLALATGRTDAARWGGGLTACWFTTVFGGYYHDHLAYVFALAGLVVYLGGGPSWRAAAGCAGLFALAYHTKQTVGVAALAALVAADFWRRGWGLFRAAFNWRCVAAYAVWQLAVLGALAAAGRLPGYLASAMNLPLAFAAQADSDKSPLRVLRTFLFPFNAHPRAQWLLNPVFAVLLVPLMAVVYAAYGWLAAQRWRRWRAFAGAPPDARNAEMVLVFLLVSTLLCAGSLGRAPAEITLGLGGVAAILLAQLPGRLRPGWWAFGFGLLAAPHAGLSLQLAEARDPAFAQTDLFPVAVRYRPYQYDLAGSAAAVEFLRSRPGKLAAVDEAAMLIPLALRRAPRGPAGYLHEGLTIPREPTARAAWERRFIEVLEREPVEYVLAVNHLDLPTPEHRGRPTAGLLASCPQLAQHLDAAYQIVFNERGYVIYARRPAIAPALAGLRVAE